eukprot:g14939.t2
MLNLSNNASRSSSFLRGLAGSTHIETPLIYSEKFSKHLGAEVFLKLDLLQPSGSFKLRGIGRTVQEAAAAGAQCIVSSSGGNAGLAAAFAARNFDLPCTVVLPTTTPQSVQEELAFYGAKVMVHGSVWDEADQKAREVVKDRKGAYVHPFDQESTWRGHATLLEAPVASTGRVETILTCQVWFGSLWANCCRLMAKGQ